MSYVNAYIVLLTYLFTAAKPKHSSNKKKTHYDKSRTKYVLAELVARLILQWYIKIKYKFLKLYII